MICHDVAFPDPFFCREKNWPRMQKTKAQIPAILTCYLTLGGYLNFVDLIPIIYKMEMTSAVSEVHCNDEYVPGTVDNTVNWLAQCHSHPPSLLQEYPLSQTLLQVCVAMDGSSDWKS